MIDFVKRVVLTEKTIDRIEEYDQYTFDVAANVTKTTLKQFIEDYYKVKVVRVNTHCPPRKKIRLGQTMGCRSKYKRAIVTLKAGDKIPLFDQ